MGRIGVDVQEPALIVSRGNGNDIHCAAGFQGLDLVGGQEHADICIAGDDRSFLGGIIRHNADEDLFQFRGIDPVGIGLENDVTARLPLTEDKRTHTDGRRLVPGRVVDRALFFEHRAQDMLGQDPVIEHVGQPGGKGFCELDDQGCVVFSGDAFHIIFEGIAPVDNILVRHDHLVAEHKVIGGDRFAIAPGHIIPQLDGDGLTVSAQAAILGGRDFGSDLRHRLVVIVERPQALVPEITCDDREPHLGIEVVQVIRFLGKGNCGSAAESVLLRCSHPRSAGCQDQASQHGKRQQYVQFVFHGSPPRELNRGTPDDQANDSL